VSAPGTEAAAAEDFKARREPPARDSPLRARPNRHRPSVFQLDVFFVCERPTVPVREPMPDGFQDDLPRVLRPRAELPRRIATDGDAPPFLNSAETEA
jgi:hypothetical protein